MIEGWGGYMPPLVATDWPRKQQESAIRQGPVVVELDLPEVTDSWHDQDATAATSVVASPWDDERRQLHTEMREELNGWLDEMARDDI